MIAAERSIGIIPTLIVIAVFVIGYRISKVVHNVRRIKADIAQIYADVDRATREAITDQQANAVIDTLEADLRMKSLHPAYNWKERGE